MELNANFDDRVVVHSKELLFTLKKCLGKPPRWQGLIDGC